MKRVLGRGLEALIPGAAAAADEKVVTEYSNLNVIREIPIAMIKPSPFQPRLRFGDEGIKELAESIKARGVIQPVVVRTVNDSYELIVGERRFRAVQSLGRETIPAVVQDTISNEEAMELTLIENLQREDLNPIDEARAFYRLMTVCNLKQDEVAAKVGKNRSTIANAIRLLSLPEKIQGMIYGGQLSASHARTLLAVPRDEEKIELAEKISLGMISVRELERAVYGDRGEKATVKRGKTRRVEIIAIEDRLKRFMGTKVEVRHGKKGGKIIIEYYSNEEFERLLELFGIEADSLITELYKKGLRTEG
jgi:ParB family chromosome partitioning protein